MKKTSAVDERMFRATLDASCRVVPDLGDPSAPAGAVLLRWRHDHFSMRIRHVGRNSFATVLRGRLVSRPDGLQIHYRVNGLADPWGWLVAVGFFGAAWFCWNEPHVASRTSCWIPVIAGVGVLSLVGFGRYATRQDAATMVELIEKAAAVSRPAL